MEVRSTRKTANPISIHGQADSFSPPKLHGVRIEMAIAKDNMTPYYDPLLAKIIARDDAGTSHRALGGGAACFHCQGRKH